MRPSDWRATALATLPSENWTNTLPPLPNAGSRSPGAAPADRGGRRARIKTEKKASVIISRLKGVSDPKWMSSRTAMTLLFTHRRYLAVRGRIHVHIVNIPLVLLVKYTILIIKRRQR